MNNFKTIILICLILTIVGVAFLPCLNNGFLNFDDSDYVTENPLIKNLSWRNIKGIFTSLHRAQYKPLLFLSYMLEYHFFKLNPFIYHFTNLIIHLLNCLLVFWLIFILRSNIFISFVVAILFGIHPLHVESVAWITERKDMLYSFFFLGSLISYLYYYSNKSRKYYYYSWVLFLLSLLSKPQGLFLPLVLLLFDYLQGRKINRQNLLEKMPFFMLSLGFLLLLYFSSFPKHLRHEEAFTFFDNFMIICYALLFYLWKLVAPLKLSFLYPYPLKTDKLLPLIFLISPIIVIIISILILSTHKYTRKIIFGGLFFLFTILLVLQIIPSGLTIVSDRYTYIPSIGFFYLIAEALGWLYQRRMRYALYFRPVLMLLLTGLIGVFAFLTWQRCGLWKDDFLLWNNVINNYPDKYIPVAYYNRGIAYIDRQENQKAASDFDKALMLYYKKLGISQDYAEAYNKLLVPDYGYSEVYNFLGIKFSEINRMQEAIVLFNRVIELQSSNIQAYINLSAAYGDAGRYKEAIIIGRKAIGLNPNCAAGHYNLAVAYYFANQHDLAFRHIEIATKLGFKPDPAFLRILEEHR